uniref:Uncharacterized protein LOC114338494 n=2 Tax=Diabrotica virgifera virgifera TaxID=50390 RepID=A0A6P7G761_DIAVI
MFATDLNTLLLFASFRTSVSIIGTIRSVTMNHNQLLIAFVIVASFALEGYCAAAAPESPPTNVTIKDYCIKETKISPDKVKKIEEESEEEIDEQGYCYIQCIFVSMELIDSKGKRFRYLFLQIFGYKNCDFVI